MPSFSQSLPTLNTVDELCSFFELSEFSLKRFCLRADSFYHTFERRKKSGKGRRKICAPVQELKDLQRQIKNQILESVEVHSACTGYRRGMSIVSNAEIHVGQRCVLNMDIEDFFQSISTARIAGLFVSLGFSEEIALTLSKICCYKNALPQGAPSSPALANLICHKLDRRLSGLAKSKGLKYSRYCDDITISGGARISPSMLELIKSILAEEGFSVNESKTRILSRKSCQTVTGLTVNEKVNIPRRRKRKMRAALHQAQLLTKLSEPERRKILGFSSFINMVKNAKKSTK